MDNINHLLTKQDNDARWRKARELLGSIVVDDHPYGDNLAIMFANYFERDVVDQETLNNSETWPQEAIDKTNQLLDKICQHFREHLLEQ